MSEIARHNGKVFLTLGQVADEIGASVHQVKYAVDQYHIKPVMRVGIIRVWTDDSLHLIRRALSQIAGNRIEVKKTSVQ